MDKIINYIMKLISCEILSTPYDNELFFNITNEDLKSMYNISLRHDLAHIIGYSLIDKKIIDEEKDEKIYNFFQEEYMTAIYRYEGLNYELEQISNVLEKAHILFMPLKGSIIRRYYDKPWMRTSCDIDVLVKETDVEKATEILKKELDYTIEDSSSHDVTLIANDSVNIELHYDLIEDNVFKKVSEILSKIWDNSIPVEGFQYKRAMKNEMFYFYHIAHMAKHFKHGGCGIRPFIDLKILNSKMSFDREKVDELLKYASLDRFEQQANKLADMWFYGAETDRSIEIMEKFVLSGGVYGNLKNMVTIGKIEKGGKFKYILHRIFLPYDIMKGYYPILKKKKYLTPFYEIGRWFKIIFKGGLEQSLNEINQTESLSKEEIKETEELMKDLKL